MQYRGVKHLDIAERVTDAYAFGAMSSVSVNTPAAGITMFGGFELVHNRKTEQDTLFYVAGGGVDIGIVNPDIKTMITAPPDAPFLESGLFSAGMTGYYSEIYNVEENVADLSETFLYDAVTAAHGPGTTFSEAYTPDDPKRTKAYSESTGFTWGEGFSRSSGASYYIPLVTQHPETGRWSLALIPFLAEFVENLSR